MRDLNTDTYRFSPEDDYEDRSVDDLGALTWRCECGRVVREGRECPTCEYGLEEGGEA